mgnify:FL=1
MYNGVETRVRVSHKLWVVLLIFTGQNQALTATITYQVPQIIVSMPISKHFRGFPETNVGINYIFGLELQKCGKSRR